MKETAKHAKLLLPIAHLAKTYPFTGTLALLIAHLVSFPYHKLVLSASTLAKLVKIQ